MATLETGHYRIVITLLSRVNAKPIYTSKFVSKGKAKSERGPRIFEFLVDDYELGVEDFANHIDMVKLLQNMIAELL